MEKSKTHLFRLLDEYLYFDSDAGYVYNCYNQKVSVENMDRIVNKYKNVNTMNKPIWITLYTRIKNNQMQEIELIPITDFEGMKKDIPTYEEVFL